MAGWRARLSLLAASGAVALGLALGLLELRARAAEATWNVIPDHAEPGRKYVIRPDSADVNHHGFRLPERTLARPPGTRRVVVVGDSVTFGAGVAADQIATALAERALREGGHEVEVINLAVHGYDIEQIAATLRHRGWAFDPQLVVYANYVNDGQPSRVMRIGATGAPVFIGDDPLWGPVGAWLQRRSALFRQARGALQVRRYEQGAYAEPFEEDFAREHLLSMAADARARGVPMAVWGLVPHVLANPDLAACWPEGKGAGYCASRLRIHARFKELSEEAGLPFISALPALRATGERAFFQEGKPDDADHPNAGGQAAFGLSLTRLLQDWLDGALRTRFEVEPPPRKGLRPPKRERRGGR